MIIEVSNEVDQLITDYQTARRKADGKITGKHRLVVELLSDLKTNIKAKTKKLTNNE